MIYAAVILGAVILFYAWLVLAARFQEEAVEFKVGDLVKISSPHTPRIHGRNCKIVYMDADENIVRIIPFGMDFPIDLTFGMAQVNLTKLALD